MERGMGQGYEETMYQPKHTKARAARKRYLILISIVILNLIFLIAVIIFVLYSVIVARENKALLHFPYVDGLPIKDEMRYPESYKSSLDSIKTMLSGYEDEKQIVGNDIDCSYISTLPPNKVCRFDLASLGDWCTSSKDFGFYEGQPCFILQLKPPIDWTPQLSSNATHVPVQCKPLMHEMSDSLGPMTMYPPSGFPRGFFPYTGQLDYLAPLVAVRFRFRVGTYIKVTCTVLDPLLDESNNAAFITEFAFEVTDGHWE